MNRSERRLLIDTGLLGLALSVLVAALDLGGVLEPLERFFYDARARNCQYFTPPPTDKLVHLDIDDPSLEAIGRWPWPRSVHAELIDELSRAGCKVVCYDVIFPDPEDLEFQPLPAARPAPDAAPSPATQPATQPATLPADTDDDDAVHGHFVDHDRLFAESLSRFGRAVIPVSVTLREAMKKPPLYQAMVTELYADPNMTPDQLVSRLKGKNHAVKEADVHDFFITARRQAIYDRIAFEMSRGDLKLEDLRDRIFPELGRNIGGSPPLSALKAERERYLAARALHHFCQPKQEGLPPLLAGKDEQLSIARLLEPAIETGYVDYIPMSDGVVRLIPMVAEHRGRILPHMGLAMACAMLDVRFRDVRLEPDRIILPQQGGGPIEIPVRSHAVGGGRYGMFFDIPWFGGREWVTMYDFPGRRLPSQHVQAAFVWECRQLRDQIAKNNAQADYALLCILGEIARDRFHSYGGALPPPEDWNTRAAMIESVLKKLAKDEIIEFYVQSLANATDHERLKIRMLIESRDALQQIARESPRLLANLEARRAELREKFAGKAALVGYTAKAAVADTIPTSLHPRCPGVVVHGVIFNAIMTGNFWRSAPAWALALLTMAIGLLTTLIVIALTPWKALSAAAVLAGGYLLFNGLYLFDYGNLILGLAGPLTAVTTVWAGGTFARYVLESRERARVKRRLGNYVDPSLVEHLLETDDRMDGVKKELTVVFTDLQGFTAVTEVLGEKTVQILNEYMSLMVPVIRRHRGPGGHPGLLNKFLGDGIMYFFGAPKSNDDHAYHAVQSVLEMQEVMIDFNRSLAERGLPMLVTRAGISSGQMIVGDAGPEDGSDYTVLGDAVNLGARLEAANKFFGTRILLNERARELVGDRVLVRPVGRLQVFGKSQGVMTYEALALTEKATDAWKELARLTQEMVTAYISADFDRCVQFIEQIEQRFQPGRLTDLYRSLCEQNLVATPADFTGQIVLATK